LYVRGGQLITAEPGRTLQRRLEEIDIALYVAIEIAATNFRGNALRDGFGEKRHRGGFNTTDNQRQQHEWHECAFCVM
jgi:hypothetical protein